MIQRVRFLIVGLCTLASHAADSQSPRGSSAAGPPSEFTFRLPPIAEHVLDNGLRVLVVEDHTLPLIAVRFVIRADELLDPPGKEGLYAVSVATLRDGTAHMDAASLSRVSAAIGTPVAPTGFTTTSENFSRALELMGDMLMHATLDSGAVERRKVLQAALVRLNAQRPAVTPRNLFYALLYGADDPLVRSYRASDSSAMSITRADVERFYHSFIQPANSVLVVVGDVSVRQALAVVTHTFGSWRGKSIDSPGPTYRRATRRGTTIFLHDTPGQLAYIYLGTFGPPRDVLDAFSMELAGTIANARFVQELRERRSFMYSGATGVVWRHLPRTSEFFGSTNVNALMADSALTEWLAMLRGLAGASPVSRDELDAARRQRLGLFASRVEGVDSIAKRVVELVRDNLDRDFFTRYVTGVLAVTPREVSAVVHKYIPTDSLLVIVTGDRRVLEPALRAAGIAPVVVVDAAGRPVP